MSYQLCPKCNGQGHVSKPRWIAGDVYQWTDTATSHLCWICNGAGVLHADGDATKLDYQLSPVYLPSKTDEVIK